MVKYKPDFERDFKWYLSVRHYFNFDGKSEYVNKNGKDVIIYDKNGLSGKESFYRFDSNGLILPTKHPNILHTLLKTKGSANLHIKMYAQSRAEELLSFQEFVGNGTNLEWKIENNTPIPVYTKSIAKLYNFPDWVINAVEKQKHHYDKRGMA
jgi:hypothetical protein